MNFAKTIGLRYLRSKKGSAFISLISGFSVAGVALGVCTLIVVLSVMDGFETALKSRLAKGEFHVLVTASETAKDQYFPEDDEKIAEIFSMSSDVLTVSPVLKTEAIIRTKDRVSGVSVRGIKEAQLNAIADLLVEASDDRGEGQVISDTGLWLGKELAYQLNILPGDKVQLISPTETEGPLESIPRLRNFVVEGIFETGLPEKDLQVAYIPIKAMREFLRKPGLINQIEVKTNSFQGSIPIAAQMRNQFGENYRIRDWKELNAHLFASLRLERIAMFLILAMIVIVASFNIVTSLNMLVLEKRKDIAILKAMGASARQIGRIFLVQGAIIGNAGTVLGGIIGLIICYLLKTSKLIELPDIFYDRSLPVEISPIYIVGILVTAVIIVMVAAWFPARAAARVSPLEGFRES